MWIRDGNHILKVVLLIVILLLLTVNKSSLSYQDDLIVVITFDDNYSSIYEAAFPILDKYCLVATNFIITDLIDKPRKLSLDQIRELEKSGWETGSHTKTHPVLTESSFDKIREECQLSKDMLSKMELAHTSFAIPTGSINEKVRKIISEYYPIIRDSHKRIHKAPVDPLKIGTFTVINNYPVDILKQRVWRAVDNGEVLLTFTFHTIEDSDYSGSYSPAKFDEFAKFLSENEFKVKTLKEAVDSVNDEDNFGCMD
jgi:peptidoglycan/xylan/chitin deacetylase (PgdA/CDA1 family)